MEHIFSTLIFRYFSPIKVQIFCLDVQMLQLFKKVRLSRDETINWKSLIEILRLFKNEIYDFWNFEAISTWNHHFWNLNVLSIFSRILKITLKITWSMLIKLECLHFCEPSKIENWGYVMKKNQISIKPKLKDWNLRSYDEKIIFSWNPSFEMCFYPKNTSKACLTSN